ncbi:MAG: hypothetical protein JNM90_14360 [Burkholderiales bacterium]|nr:hypothetical protein [Burkholderiales bacterium]
MKVKALTSACLLALGASQAHALDPATTGAATTVKVFGSGASAQINTITGLFGTLCDGTPDVYTFSGNVKGVSCKVKAGVSELAGKNVFLSYNADGGSGNGVYPIAKLVGSGGAFTADPAAQRPQIVDPASCTGSSPNYTCASATLGNRWSDFGVSDVEPAMFAFDLNKPAAFASTSLEQFELDNMDVGSQFQVVFGIAATNKLYNDLATAQGVSVPSIPRTALSSLLAGNLSDPASGLGWQVLFADGVGPDATASSGAVNIGRRVNGSGTQTAANAYFLGYGCSPTANLVPADASYTNPGSIVVNEGSGTSNVTAFLNARNTAGEYGIGLVSKENSNVGQGWTHVAIDGVVPSRDNAKSGKYDYVYEQTMQWNTKYLDDFRTVAGPTGAGYALPVGVTVANLKNFLSVFRTRSGAPLVLDSLASAATKEGITALINDTEGYIYNDSAATPEGLANKKFVSRMTRNGSSCQTPIWNK